MMKIAVVDNSTVVWASSPKNPREYPQGLPSVSSNWSHWPIFLLLIVWIYLYSIFLCSRLQKTRLFCNRVRIVRLSHPASTILVPIESACETSY